MTPKLTPFPEIALIALFALGAGCAPSTTTQTRHGARRGYISPSIAIHHPDWKRRVDAVDFLAEMQDNRSLALLAFALKDKDARVRAAAIRALGSRKDRSTLGPIAKAVQDPDERVRLSAVAALQELIGVQAVSIALHRLGVGSPKERRAVIDCLGKQLKRSEGQNRNKMLKRLVIMVKAERPQTQKDAMAVVEKIGALATDALLNALAAARPGSRGPWMKQLESLLLKSGKPALKSLLQAIEFAADGEAQAKAAIPPLVRIGRPAVPHLIALLDWRKKRSELTRSLAETTLVRIGQPAVPALVALLVDKRPDRRLLALRLLGNIGRPHARKWAMTLVTADRHWAVRRAAVRLLTDLGSREALEPILVALRTDTASVLIPLQYAVYRRALLALKPAPGRLLKALRSSQPQVRLVAAQVTAELNPAGGVTPLLALLQDSSPVVIAAAARALGLLKEKTAVGPLKALLNHENLSVNVQAATALGRIADETALSALLTAARSKTKLALSTAAVIALGRLARRSALKVVRRAGYSPYWVTRSAARWALAQIQGKTTSTPNATLCGLLVTHQMSCSKGSPDVVTMDPAALCRHGGAAQWAPLLKATDCASLQAAAQRVKKTTPVAQLVTHWDAAKQAKYQQVAYRNGVRHGLLQRWYANGKPMLLGRFDKGKRQGRWTHFWDSGKKRIQCSFVNGTRSGPFMRWYDDATQRETGTLVKGRRVGIWTEFHENGQKSMVMTYHNNHLQGIQRSYYPNGTMSGEALYRGGRREGVWQTWYRSGKKRSMGQYTAGVRSGAWVWFHKNGKRRESGRFNKGIKAGRWSTWDKRGIRIEICEYGASGTPRCNR